MSDILNIGIIGAGRIGKVHAATLAYRIPSARVLAIADIDLAAAQQTAGQFCIPVAVDDAAAVLANKEIDAVLICASTDTHARLTIEAAQAGKHIFCEKPIAHDLAEIDAVLAAVAKAGVKLQIGFNRRFDANFAARAPGDRGRRDRHARAVAHHQPRSRPAARLLRQGIRRHVPGHDHPRLRHGPLPGRR